MHKPNVESGTIAATEISKTVIDLLNRGVVPADIAIATTGLGLAMLKEHMGQDNAAEIASGLIEKALSGELSLHPSMKAANANHELDI